jgi:hypothetical protein
MLPLRKHGLRNPHQPPMQLRRTLMDEKSLHSAVLACRRV